MSAAISPSTQRPYGVQRVCRVWAVARSSFYAAANRPAETAPPARRGPVPPVDETSLLAAIQADLAASPFQGEGHRKVWARLRYGLGLPVGRNRVLRLMRENQLLSPHRRPPRPANDHDGTIVTEAPNVLWGTDATMVQTVEDGRVWIFAALDHFNAEVIGHYVSTDGSRFSALEPLSQAVTARFGAVGADAARGVSVRADNGPQYIARHFTQQVKHWGMAMSYAYPYQPECNGIAERWFRTLKEQTIYGRIFCTVAEVKAAVADFVARYNACWPLERLGYRSPLDYRARFLDQPKAAA
ncbi:IS3 family transposase [Azospirillum canadense]|uniref:IS3 family transposase n=1 Tax=Azospirillum canadense TaxID=403962 RepID=UPI002225BC52|nr:IS3 family transposase [Azospirillum canadense]MCW2241919.1 transposase InsO family protein [Azospirillum canadense]